VVAFTVHASNNNQVALKSVRNKTTSRGAPASFKARFWPNR